MAEHVHAKFTLQRVRKLKAVELSDNEIARFNRAMTDIGTGGNNANALGAMDRYE